MKLKRFLTIHSRTSFKRIEIEFFQAADVIREILKFGCPSHYSIAAGEKAVVSAQRRKL